MHYFNKLIKNSSHFVKEKPELIKYKDINSFCYNSILKRFTKNERVNKIQNSFNDICTQWKEYNKELGKIYF